jgi:nicotinamidase-related amidase
MEKKRLLIIGGVIVGIIIVAVIAIIAVVVSPTQSKSKSALIVVDVQNDFINGTLKVNNSYQIIPVINNLLQSVKFDLVIYTHDWHPANHCSFIGNTYLGEMTQLNGNLLANKKVANIAKENLVAFQNSSNRCQPLWNPHCIQNTTGAHLHDDLIIVKNSIDVYKGTHPDTVLIAIQHFLTMIT